ncbi:HPP family protein [Indiicoccus explosivorum]|uniref:CBS domain-containing protein n=1 Tax=Indiicoccus explosivorum TaxID=1917864 RepID=UPI000B433D52|nr:CBS domain-containing protein [Indiicoccus explosivorum]
MFVKSVMVKREKCIKISPEDLVKTGMELLEKHHVDALPVVEGNTYKGIFTWYHAYRAYFESGKSKEDFLTVARAGDIIVNGNVSLGVDAVYEEALLKLNDFPIIAVTAGEEFLGIVTRFDVMNQLQSAFGYKRKGIRISITSAETEGQIGKLAEVIDKYRESVISLVTFDETDKLIRRIVLKIEKKNNADKFLKELGKAGFRVLDITEEE